MNSRPFVIGVVLVLFGFFMLFLAPSMGFWMCGIGGGLIFVYYMSPQRKEELAQGKANKQASIEHAQALEQRAQVVEQRFQQFSNNPSDTESLEYVLSALATQEMSSLKKWMRMIVIPLLKARPLDASIRNIVITYAKKTITTKFVLQNEASSGEVYEAALDVLSQYPDQIPLKQYALEVGRWHYGIQRPNGKVTIYDEQAIQNDIVVRSK
jgi:hypothetical protein